MWPGESIPIDYPMPIVSPETIIQVYKLYRLNRWHLYVYIYTYIFLTMCYMYVIIMKKETINLEDSKEVYMGGFGQRIGRE